MAKLSVKKRKCKVVFLDGIREKLPASWRGIDFRDAEIIKEILLSQEVEDYRLIRYNDFFKMSFDDFRFRGTGETLMRRYFDVKGNVYGADWYEIFVYEILGDHYFYLEHETIEQQEIEEQEIEQQEIQQFADDRPDPFYEIVREELDRDLVEVLRHLSAREVRYIFLEHGIGCPELNKNQIAKLEKLTRERVNQILTKALNKTRYYLRYCKKNKQVKECLAIFDKMPNSQDTKLKLDDVLSRVKKTKPPLPSPPTDAEGYYKYLFEVIEEEGGFEYLKQMEPPYFFYHQSLGGKSKKWRKRRCARILEDIRKIEGRHLSSKEAFELIFSKLYPENFFGQCGPWDNPSSEWYLRYLLDVIARAGNADELFKTQLGFKTAFFGAKYPGDWPARRGSEILRDMRQRVGKNYGVRELMNEIEKLSVKHGAIKTKKRRK